MTKKYWNSLSSLKFSMSSGRYFTPEKTQAKEIAQALNSELRIVEDDVVVDFACGTGIYHPYINECMLFGIDFSNESLSVARKKNPQFSYIELNILDSKKLLDLLNDIRPNKVIINSYIHYLDRNQLYLFLNTVTKCKYIKYIFIGDIPLIDKRETFSSNRQSLYSTIKFLIIRNITGLFTRDLESPKTYTHSRDAIYNFFINHKFYPEWLSQSKSNQFYKTRENLFLTRW